MRRTIFTAEGRMITYEVDQYGLPPRDEEETDEDYEPTMEELDRFIEGWTAW